ncbi:MAG: hypothetical protein MUF71_18110 [Candidatus Kapabacteria bacterium]|nr:hypothetical protein [Candidatus Kapabacteria bacterium]
MPFLAALLIGLVAVSCKQMLDDDAWDSTTFASVSGVVSARQGSQFLSVSGASVEVNGTVLTITDSSGTFVIRNTLVEGSHRFRFIGLDSILLDTVVQLRSPNLQMSVNMQTINLRFLARTSEITGYVSSEPRFALFIGRLQAMIGGTTIFPSGIKIELDGRAVATTDTSGGFTLQNLVSEGQHRIRCIGRSNAVLLDSTITIIRPSAKNPLAIQTKNILLTVLLPPSEFAFYGKTLDFPLAVGNEWVFTASEFRNAEHIRGPQWRQRWQLSGEMKMTITSQMTYPDSTVYSCQTRFTGLEIYYYGGNNFPIGHPQFEPSYSTSSSVTYNRNFSIVLTKESLTLQKFDIFLLYPVPTTATVPLVFLNSQTPNNITITGDMFSYNVIPI